MKRNVKNDKVVRAITIGLAAMIAATSVPMNVLADETAPEGGSEEPSYRDVENGVADEAQSKASESKEKIGNKGDESNGASGSVADVIKVYDIDGKEINSKEDGLEKETAENLDAALNVGPSAENPSETTVQTDLENATSDITSAEGAMLVVEGTDNTSANEAVVNDAEKQVDNDIEAADVAITDANTANTDAKNAETSINEKAKEANEKASDVNDKSKAAQVLADEAAKIVNDADEQINGKTYAEGEEPEVVEPSLQDKFDAGKNAGQMQTAYNEISAVVTKAREDFDAKVEEYNNAKKNYDDAKEEYDVLYEKYVAAYGDSKAETPEDGTYLAGSKKASDDYDTAKGKYEDAVGKFNDDMDSYDEAIGNLNKQIETYNGAIESASKSAADAAEDLKKAKEKLDKLKSAADAAYAEVNTALTAGAQTIEKAQKDLKENATDENKFNLFKAYVENFYIPQTEEGSTAVVKDAAEEKYDTTRWSYYEVAITDKNGNKTVKYMNYKVSEDGTVSLYEIPDIIVKGNEALNKAKEKNGETNLVAMYVGSEKNPTIYTLPNNMKVGDTYVDANGNKILKSGVDNGSGYIYTYVINGEETTLSDVPEEGSFITGEEGERVLTEITVGEEGAPVYSYDKENKEVVKTVTTEVTTVTYHEASLSNKDEEKEFEGSFDTKDDAEEAMKAAIEGLDENDKAIEGDVINGTVTSRTVMEKYTETETYEEEVEKSEDVDVDSYTASGEFVSSFTKTIKLTSENIGYTCLWEDYDEDIEKSHKIVASNINNQFNSYSDGSIVDVDGKSCLVISASLSDISYSDPDPVLFEGHGHFTVSGSAEVTATLAEIQTVTLSKDDTVLIKELTEKYEYYSRDWTTEEPTYFLFWQIGTETVYHHKDNFAEAVAKYYADQKGLCYKGELKGSGDSFSYTYVAKETISGEKKKAEASRDASVMEQNNANAKIAAKDSLDKKTEGKTLIGEINFNKETTNESVKYTEKETRTKEVTKEREKTVWDYKVSYFDCDETVTESKNTVTKNTVTTYTEASRLFETHAASQGEHRIKLTNDESANELGEFLKEQDGLLTKYKTLSEDVEKAQGSVAEAQEKVTALQKQIDGYKSDNEIIEEEIKGLKSTIKEIKEAKIKTLAEWELEKYEARLTELTETLSVKEEELENAKEKLSGLEAQLEADLGILNAQIERERRDNTRRPGGNGAGNFNLADLFGNQNNGGTVADAGESAGEAVATIVGVTPAAAMAVGDFAAPVIGAAGGVAGVVAPADVAGVRVEEELVEEVGPTEEKEVEEKIVAATPKKKAGVELEENKTPLAATPFDEERENMNWWWLILVVLLGATGTAMYENHKKKQAEKADVAKAAKKEKN